MKVRVIKTEKIESGAKSLDEILDRADFKLKPRTVVAVTSKIVALCQGRAHVYREGIMHSLVPEESEFYMPPELNDYGVWLSIKSGRLIPNAGIDRSNSNGLLVLWPEDPQKAAESIRSFLVERAGTEELGVIITDSTTSPLRAGVTGISIAHSGFEAVRSLIGKEDIFGQTLKMTKVNVADALAAAAVFMMGESAEQTPIALIEDLDDRVVFTGRAPAEAELEEETMTLESDLYGALLKAAPWQVGKARIEAKQGEI
ncbi:putative folate metabolism gamma-glutamate ligase [bacterium]|nr:putative folate metabolism gamma-glutamate ligase [bacterium]